MGTVRCLHEHDEDQHQRKAGLPERVRPRDPLVHSRLDIFHRSMYVHNVVHYVAMSMLSPRSEHSDRIRIVLKRVD